MINLIRRLINYYIYGITEHSNGVIEYDNDIFIIKRELSNELCDQLREIIDKNLNEMENEILSNKYNVECKYIKLQELINRDINNNTMRELDKILFGKIHENMKKIIMIKKYLTIDKDDGYVLRRIHGGTKMHADGVILMGDKQYLRTLTMITQLNDDFEGGVYEFPEQNVKIKLDKGDMIFFPPFWTHPHKVSKVENNTFRYTLHTWFHTKIIS